MGKPSNRRRSARRPGKRQRARVKNRKRRADFVGFNVLGAGTVVEKRAGRKHMDRFYRWLGKAEHEARLSENQSRKPGESADGLATSDKPVSKPVSTHARSNYGLA